MPVCGRIPKPWFWRRSLGTFFRRGKKVPRQKGKRIATPVRTLVRNDRGRRTAVVGSQEWVQGTASACGSINKIVPGVLPRTMPKHRDTTLLRRLLTQVGLMKCRYTSALLRAPPSEPKAHAALGPAAPEPCSPVRSAPAFTWPGSLWRSKMGYSFLHCHFKILSENFFEIFRQTGLIFPSAGGNSARLF